MCYRCALQLKYVALATFCRKPTHVKNRLGLTWLGSVTLLQLAFP